MKWRILYDGATQVLIMFTLSSDVFLLSTDRFATFRRILYSLLTTADLSKGKIVNFPPIRLENIGEEEDPSERADILEFVLQQRDQDQTICKVTWSGYTQRNLTFLGELEFKFFIRDEEEERPARALDVDLVCQLQAVVNESIRDTLQNLKLRGTLKASREDLIAQLASPGKIRGSALALEQQRSRGPVESPSEESYETAFENFLPGEGTMYQNFNVRGGKTSKKRKNRSQSKRSKTQIVKRRKN